SNCIYHTMMGIPGLKVVLPSTPADAKGLMAAAIRDDNPVVYLHPYMLMIDSGEVPEGEFVVPIGIADVKRQGTDITIVATGWMVKKSLAAAEQPQGARFQCVSETVCSVRGKMQRLFPALQGWKINESLRTDDREASHARTRGLRKPRLSCPWNITAV